MHIASMHFKERAREKLADAKLQRNLRKAGATDAAVRARYLDGTWSLRIDIPLSQSSHLTHV